MNIPPRAITEGLAKAKNRERRFDVAKAAMQGLAAGMEWQTGRVFDVDELAADAVALADALLAKLAESQ